MCASRTIPCQFSVRWNHHNHSREQRASTWPTDYVLLPSSQGVPVTEISAGKPRLEPESTHQKICQGSDTSNTSQHLDPIDLRAESCQIPLDAMRAPLAVDIVLELAAVPPHRRPSAAQPIQQSLICLLLASFWLACVLYQQTWRDICVSQCS